MSMGFPTTNPTHKAQKCIVAENAKSVKSFAAYAESIPQEVATKEEKNNKSELSIVQKITSFLADFLNIESTDSDEKEAPKGSVAQVQSNDILSKKRGLMIVLINGIAYYIEERSK